MAKKTTPMMKQFLDIKARYPEVLILFRMGDFYETFNDDAIQISKILGITLTTRGGEDATPLAGFPYHALDAHLPKLLKAGLKVARVEQVEDPKTAKGLVKRDVVEIISPGSTLSDKLLEHNQNNYILSLLPADSLLGIAIADISTGEFLVVEADLDQLGDLLNQYRPTEILTVESGRAQIGTYTGLITTQDNWHFDYTYAYESLLKHFEVQSLKGFGCDDFEPGLQAAGALLSYLKSNYQDELVHFTRMETIHLGSTMKLDPATQRNLELIESLTGAGEGTLISILDHTETPMGGRLLRKWVVHPLLDVNQITARHERVDILLQDDDRLREIQSTLSEIGDIERIIGRVATGRTHPRELLFLKRSLSQFDPLKKTIQLMSADYWNDLIKEIENVDDIIDVIESAIHPDAPATLTEGNIIATGYDKELDELKEIALNGKTIIAGIQEKERERTGIPSLKIKYNKVFGYYLDVTNTHKDKVPDDYIRKQTLVNSERYITAELKDYEEKVLTAESQINDREYEIFQQVRETLAKSVQRIQSAARIIAEIDCLAGFAAVAREQNYHRPKIDNSTHFSYQNGRHPVVETLLPPGQIFTTNDIHLEPDQNQIMVITGPNMAGKSTYLRQTGLIVLMAQIGSFVPASNARIGVVDRIFTRVGASDNIASGESTFMVEMNEAANILNHATQRSLILFDELGRGTSTFDGLSIAWAVVEYLHTQSQRAAKTLFATHYHELTELELLYPRIQNYNVAVEEYDDHIIFLRKIIRGGTDHSYGIQVARMAGMPESVIERAKEILQNLEDQELDPNSQKPGLARRHRGRQVDQNQINMFQIPEKRESQIEKRIRDLSINDMTPIDALNELNELKQLLKDVRK